MKSVLRKLDIVILTGKVRLHFLVIVWLTILGFYYIAILEGFSTHHCLTVSEFWLSDKWIVSPFFMFCLIVGLLFLWAVVEFWMAWSLPRQGRKVTLGILVVFIFLLAGWGVGLSAHWEMLQVDRGVRTYEETWFATPDPDRRPFGPAMSFQQFLQRKRCDEGIDTDNLTPDQLCELQKEYGLTQSLVSCLGEDDRQPSLYDDWKEGQRELEKLIGELKEYKANESTN